MTSGLLIIAHSPLASALRECVLHVFPDGADVVAAVDIRSDQPMDELIAESRKALADLGTVHTLVFTDVFGATPCNVAQKLVDGVITRLVAGVNLPMLLRVMNYAEQSLDELVNTATAGARNGVIVDHA